MRISVVPAQITSVEDKIVADVSIQQAILLGSPILFGFIITSVFPPSGEFVTYKIAAVLVLFFMFSPLAIRIDDRIIIQWLKIILIYCIRPHHYIHNKNSIYLRNIESMRTNFSKETITKNKKTTPLSSNISQKEFVRLQHFTTDTKTVMKFEVGKKGKLNVRITEVN